jgi:acetolactate synthase-1/2/3 large subunit
VKKNQRFISNIGCASMGYDLPGAIGAAVATKGKKRIICIAGDGSIQMNLQELQTIVHNKFPIVIFVLNNEGYLAIRNTQDAYFKSRYIGADKNHGVSCPDIVKIAKAYGIPAFRIANQKNLRRHIKKILRMKGPVICDIMMDPKQPLIPKAMSLVRPDGSVVAKPPEDMYPFVDRNEFMKNMIISASD